MANERIELDIIAKGKPAEKAIKGVEKKTKDLGKISKQTGEQTDGMLSKMKLGWIAVGASVVKATTAAVSFERASIGLTKAQKAWAMETSLATEIQAEQVAGFLKSAQTAGLNEEQMKDLATQAIALGYAFPHEQAETLHDNLVMLAKTGEAQGFVVDILEQKYVGLGDEISTLDLKTKSWEEKLRLVNEVVQESQRQMDASKFKEYHEMIGEINNSFTELGTTLITLGSDGKGFSFAANAAETFKNVILFIAAGIKQVVGDLGTLGEYLGIFEEKMVVLNDTQKEQLSTEQKLANLSAFRISLVKELTIATGSHKEAVERQISIIDKQVEGLTKYGDAHYYVKEQIKLSREEHEKLKETVAANEGMWDGVKGGLEEYIKTGKDADAQQKEFGKVGGKIAQNMEDAFVNMAMGVKTSFRSMAQSIIADLIRIQVRKKIAGFLGDFFDSGTSSDTTTTTKHTGGAIGSTRIPSFHQGFRSDERLAKLQVGEAVVNRAGAARNARAIDAMNAGMAVGSGGDTQVANITFEVRAFDSASFQQGMVENRATIVGVVRQAFNRNGRSVAL